MSVVLTRPTIESEALARELASQHIDSIVAPMLSIVARERPDLEADLDRAQAVLLTSANGARALAETTERRDLSLFVVGEATATAAHAAGFTDVESADGDAAALAALVVERLKPDAGPLLHISGDHVAGDIEGAISGAGFDYQRTVLYDAVAAAALPEALIAALKAGSVGSVLLFSPRSARTFVHLARTSEVAPALKQVTAYCLSDAVAAVADRELWRRTVVSARPRSDSLIERVVADLGTSGEEQAPVVVTGPVSRPAAGLAEAKAAHTRTWPIIVASMAASALVAIIVVFALRAVPVNNGATDVPPDLEPRLRSLDSLGSDLADRLAAVEAQERSLIDLADRVEAAEAQLAQMAATTDGAVGDADLAALATQLDATRSDLNQEIARVAQTLSTNLTGVADAVEALTERVDRIGVRDAGAAGALLLAVGQLRAAAVGPGPFADEVKAVRALARGEPRMAGPLAAMTPWASQGVATAEMLQTGFQDAALAILRAEDLPADAGWLETAYAEVKGLVTVRRVGEDAEGDDPQAVLARAEARLARGDLAGAVTLVESIGEAGKAAEEWLAAARGRTAVSAALDEISSIAFVRAGTATPNP